MLDRIGMDCRSMNIIVDGNDINTLIFLFSQKAALAPVGGLERHCERMDDPTPPTLRNLDKHGAAGYVQHFVEYDIPFLKASSHMTHPEMSQKIP